MAEFVSITAMPQYKDLLDELFDVESGLSNKEIDFMDSLNDWDGAFTEKQAEYLISIHEKAFR